MFGMDAIQMSSVHSSPSSFEDESTPIMNPNWQQILPPGALSIQSPSPTTSGNNLASQHPLRPVVPMQKRRRVTRACDECRRKKIKCDGKLPCTHCTVYSYDCTYDQPSNRRRNPGPQYIETLENRVKDLCHILKLLVPSLDVEQGNFDAVKVISQLQSTGVLRGLSPDEITSRPNGSNGSNGMSNLIESQEGLLDSMVEAVGRLEIDEESGQVDFHGHSSGIAYLSNLRYQLEKLVGIDVLKEIRYKTFSSIADSSRVSNSSASENILPTRELAKELVESCFADACVLLRFIHRPTFDEMVDRIYDTPESEWSLRERSFLRLLYLALAVGCLFYCNAEESGFDRNICEGTKYFLAGRRMMEITDCHDTTSIQTIILMITFLQSTSTMSTCYSYVGIALSASVRMGLHRSLPNQFDNVERETRKRIFWTVRKMDTYVSALLGLPKGIADEDIDQEMPLEVDDEYITREAILPQPDGKVSMMAAANAHTKLLRILAKVVNYIYPLRSIEARFSANGPCYKVSYTKIKEIEGDLAAWVDSLPPEIKPGGDTPAKFRRPQYLLKMAYAHVQLMLYRPFIHYIAHGNKNDYGYSAASSCITVATKITHITDEMRREGFLNGAYWFTMYTTFFAVVSLVFYVLEHPEGAGQYLEAAQIGRTALESLRDKSFAAKRCSALLQSIFDSIPRGIKIKPETEVQKKRARAGSHSGLDIKQDPQPCASQDMSCEFDMCDVSISSKDLPQNEDCQQSTSTTHGTTLDRKTSFELYAHSEFLSSTTASPDQQAVPYNQNGLSAVSSTIQPATSIENFAYHNVSSPMEYQSHQKPNALVTCSDSSAATYSSGQAYDSIEAQFYNPWQTYAGLVQGNVNTINSGGVGSVTANPNFMLLQNQGFETISCGGTDMGLEGFFGEEWDEVIMAQNRNL